jgi:hypothetical protein
MTPADKERQYAVDECWAARMAMQDAMNRERADRFYSLLPFYPEIAAKCVSAPKTSVLQFKRAKG